MTVDLKWRDAMALAGRFFGAAERSDGWPLAMLPMQLAAIQRPFEVKDVQGKAKHAALARAIGDACATGQLAHTLQNVTRLGQWKSAPTAQMVHRSIGPVWEPSTRLYREPKTTAEPFITAQAFGEWLRKQGEEPSQHLAHWLNVQGVVEHAPVLELVPKATALPTTWKGLVAYHKANPGHLFPPALKNIVAIERNRRGDQPGAAAAMAAELGISTARLNELVRTKDEHGKRQAVQTQRTGTK